MYRGSGDGDSHPKYRDRSPLKPREKSPLSPGSREVPSSTSPTKSPKDSQQKSPREGFGFKSHLQQPKGGLAQLTKASEDVTTKSAEESAVVPNKENAQTEPQKVAPVKPSRLAKPKTSLPKPSYGKADASAPDRTTAASDSAKRSSLPRFAKDPSHDKLSSSSPDSAQYQKPSSGSPRDPMTLSYHEQSGPHWQVEYKRQASFEHKRTSGIPRPGQRKSVSPPKSSLPIAEHIPPGEGVHSADQGEQVELDKPYEVTTPTRVTTQTALTLAYDTDDKALADSSSDGDSPRGSRGSSPRIATSPCPSGSNSPRITSTDSPILIDQEDIVDGFENQTFTKSPTISDKPRTLDLTYEMDNDEIVPASSQVDDMNQTYHVASDVSMYDASGVTDDTYVVKTTSPVQQLQSPIPDLLTPSALYVHQAALELSEQGMCEEPQEEPLGESRVSHISAVSSLGVLSDDQLCNNSLLSDEFRFTREQFPSNNLIGFDVDAAEDLLEVSPVMTEGVLEVDLEVCSIDNPDLATPDITSPSVSSVNESDQKHSTVSDTSAICELSGEKTEVEEDLTIETSDSRVLQVSANRTYDLASQPDVTRDAQSLILEKSYASSDLENQSFICSEIKSTSLKSGELTEEHAEPEISGILEVTDPKISALSSTFEVPSCNSKLPVQMESYHVLEPSVNLEKNQLISDNKSSDQDLTAAQTFTPLESGKLDLLDKQSEERVLDEEVSVSLKRGVTSADNEEELAEHDQLLSDLEAGHSRFDRPVSMISTCSGDTGIVVDMSGSVTGDAVDGSRKERPVSLISTSSADTGYQPDTDSEMGTLTANSPSYDECSSGASGRTALYHSPTKRNPSPTEGAHVSSSQAAGVAVSTSGDADLFSDAGTLVGEADIETDKDESEMSECIHTDCVTDTVEELSDTESQQDSLEDHDIVLRDAAAEADNYASLPVGGANIDLQQPAELDRSAACSVDSLDSIGIQEPNSDQQAEEEPEVLGILTPDEERIRLPDIFTFPESSTDSSQHTSPHASQPKISENTVVETAREEKIDTDSEVTHEVLDLNHERISVPIEGIEESRAEKVDFSETLPEGIRETSSDLEATRLESEIEKLESVIHDDLKEYASSSQLRVGCDSTFPLDEFGDQPANNQIQENINGGTEVLVLHDTSAVSCPVPVKEEPKSAIGSDSGYQISASTTESNQKLSEVPTATGSVSEEKHHVRSSSTESRTSDGEFSDIQIAGACVVLTVEASHMNNNNDNQMEVVESDSPEKDVHHDVDVMCDFVVADCHDPQESRNSPPVVAMETQPEPMEEDVNITGTETADDDVHGGKPLSPVKESAEVEPMESDELPQGGSTEVDVDDVANKKQTVDLPETKPIASKSPKSRTVPGKITKNATKTSDAVSDNPDSKKSTTAKSKVTSYLRKTSVPSKTTGQTDNPKLLKNVTNKKKVDTGNPVKKTLTTTKPVGNPDHQKPPVGSRKTSLDRGKPGEQKTTASRKLSVDRGKPDDVKKPIQRAAPKSKWDNIMSGIDNRKTPITKSKSDTKTAEGNPGNPGPRSKLTGNPGAHPAKSASNPGLHPTKSTAKPDATTRTRKVSGLLTEIESKKLDVKRVTPVTSVHSPRLSVSKRTASPGVDSLRSSTRSSHSDQDESHSTADKARAKTSVTGKSVTRTGTSLHERSPSVQSDVTSQGSKARQTATESRLKTTKRRSLAEVTSANNIENTRRSSIAATSKRPVPSATVPKVKRASIAGVAPPTATSTPKKPTTTNQKTTKSKTSVRDIKRSNQPDLVTNSVGPTAQEISRLEALCETRTKELNYVKMQLRAGIAGFDAMAVLIKYLTEELDAFSCPRVTEKLAGVTEELQRVLVELGELKQQKEKLEAEIGALSDQYKEQTEKMKADHKVALGKLEQRLQKEKEDELERVIEQHSHEVTTLKSYHDKHVLEMKKENEKLLEEQAAKQEEEVSLIQRKHESHFKELQRQHECRLHEITGRLEEIKYTLSGKVETLRLECEELRRKEQQYLEAFQRDSDIKVQMALGPYKNLPAEIESLKCVLELKNQEVRELRCHKMELEKQLEELPKAKEKIRSLEQKIENLEAIIDIKSDYEKQLSEKHHALRRRYDRESKANKRLSMDNETLSWRLSQTDLDSPDVVRRQVSRSPTNSESSSPDPPRRRKSPTQSTSSTDLDKIGSVMTRSYEKSPLHKSPPKTNLRRSGTYDLQDVERIDQDLRQTNV